MRLSDIYYSQVKEAESDDPNCKCLIWTGRFNHDDFPVVRIDGTWMTAYTLAWMVDGGMASDGPFVKTCRTPGCVLVDHLRMKSDDPYQDELAIDERLEDGWRMIDSGEDEDLSDQDEEWL